VVLLVLAELAAVLELPVLVLLVLVLELAEVLDEPALFELPVVLVVLVEAAVLEV
jgi:hypothetical protein